MKSKLFLILFIVCFSCITVDTVFKPEIIISNLGTERAVIIRKDSATLSLAKGKTQKIDLEYRNEEGVKESKPITWDVKNKEIASVESGTNVITAIAAGNTLLTGTFGNAKIKINLTVTVASANIISGGKLVIMDNGKVIDKGSSATLALQIGETQPVTLEYTNENGVKENQAFTWVVAKPSLASVANNTITALAPGNTLISASTPTGVSISVDLTVVSNSTEVASVTVAPPSATGLQKNQIIQLTATPKNINNANLAGKTIEWFTENAAIVSVSTTGLVTGVADGIAGIHAKVEGVKSNSIIFTVSSAVANMRTGTFQGSGSYQAAGTVTMKEVQGGVEVILGSDYKASVALGTFLYLASSTSGGNVKTNGRELGEWSMGEKKYTISGVTLSQYNYVVVLCKPAGITFGFAELKP